jgi:hypothetical protein
VETILGWLFGQGAEAAKEIGLAWLVRNTLLHVLDGSDQLFDRFLVVGGILMALALVVLFIWHGNSWAGKFRFMSLPGVLLSGLACVLVLYGMADLTVTRVLAARGRVLSVAPSQATPSARHAAVRQVLEQPKATVTFPPIPESN